MPPSLARQIVLDNGGEEEIFVEETEASLDKARQVLQAAAVEAYGRPRAYVTGNHVMKRANILDPEEFRMIAQYLDKKG